MMQDAAQQAEKNKVRDWSFSMMRFERLKDLKLEDSLILDILQTKTLVRGWDNESELKQLVRFSRLFTSCTIRVLDKSS
jgi:hypothetical protein